MDNNFASDEQLYRAVEPISMYMKDDGTLTSAAYKSPDGCSVDRGAYRSDGESAKALQSRLRGAVYSISVFNCNEKDIFINYEPLENDIYHSCLYKNKAFEKMTAGQCKHLAKSSRRVAD